MDCATPTIAANIVPTYYFKGEKDDNGTTVNFNFAKCTNSSRQCTSPAYLTR